MPGMVMDLHSFASRVQDAFVQGSGLGAGFEITSKHHRLQRDHLMYVNSGPSPSWLVEYSILTQRCAM